MVFWSSFAKKIKQSVSQVSFDALKNRVTNVETKNQQQDTEINSINSTLNTNSTNIVNLNNVKADKTALEVVDNKVDGVISGLQNGNIVNYTGVYNSTTNYNIGQCVTYNDKWYVSNQNNNVGHTPTGSSDNYWELLSEPTINLNPYLTKSEAHSTYATQNELNGFETNTTQTLNGLDSRISNLQSAKADKSYVDNLIVFSNWEQLSYRMTWLNTSNTNNRDWKFVGKLDNNIVPNNLIDIKFELRGYDFGLSQQWYELISYGWYKTPFNIIVWFHSPASRLDDYNLIARNTYFQFISKR